MNSLAHPRFFRWFFLLAFSVAGAVALSACMVKTEDDTVTVAVDAAWLEFDDFELIWADPSGAPQALLFKGPLQNEGSLTRIPGQGYQGEAAIFILKGYEGGVLVFEQHRDFDPNRQPPTVVIVVKDPWNSPTGLAITPKRVELEIGENGQAQASVLPAASPQAMTWQLSNPTLAQLSVAASDPSSASLTALVQGRTWLKAVSVADPALRDSIPVDIFPLGEAPPSITAFTPDTVVSVWDEVAFTVAVQARNGLLAAWSLDADGDGTPEFEGQSGESALSLTRAHVYQDSGNRFAVFTVADNGGRVSRDTVEIGVRLDPPRVNAGADTVVQPNETVVFDGMAEQDFGVFVMWRWDFDGDGVDDDSSAAPKSFVFKYPVEGSYAARLRVRDDDGNVGEGVRTVDVGNATPGNLAPVFSGTLSDTTISILDSLTFAGRVEDGDGTIDKLEWDFGTGTFGQATTTGTAAVDFSVGKAFPDSGTFSVVARATDNGGKTSVDSVVVTVLLDPPTVDAGDAVSVLAGGTIALSGSASDRLGSIASLAWKIGNGEFLTRSKGDTSFSAPGTPQTLWGVFRAVDDDGNAAIDSVEITVLASTNNLLESLAVTPGTLAPAFQATTLTYSASVGNSVSSVSITANPADPASALTINGTATTAGSPRTVNLDVGANPIPIVVIAQDSSEQTYTLTVTRAADADANLQSLTVTGVTLSPAPFAANTAAYSAGVPYATTSVSVTAVAQSATAKVTVNSLPVNSNPSLTVSLPNVGANPISIVVTAQDGTKKTYTVTLTRAQDNNNNLQSLAVAGVTLSPGFSAATTAYSGTVASTATSVSITATVQSDLAKLTVNGLTATSGAARSVNVNPGANAIAVVVTAADSSKKTYTLNITRSLDGTNTLSALVPSAGAFTSPFSSTTSTYDWVVPDGSATVRLTPTASASTSTIHVSGSLVTSGSPSSDISLTAGAQTNDSVVVTAQNGSKRTYRLRIHRGGWVQAGGSSSPAAGSAYAMASDGTSIWQIANEGGSAVLRKLVGSNWNVIQTFSTVTNPTVLDVACSGSYIYVMTGNASNGMQLYYSANGGTGWTGKDYGSVGAGRLAANGSSMYAIYTPNYPTTGSVRVTRFVGSSFDEVGTASLEQFSEIDEVDVAVGTTGTPWIAFKGLTNTANQAVRVMTLSAASAWTTTGGGSSSAVGSIVATKISLALLSNQPYLLYSDGGATERLSAIKVNEPGVLGSRGFSPSGIITAKTRLISDNGVLYAAACLDNASRSGNRVTGGYAWKWNGAAWESLGGGPVAEGTSTDLSFTALGATPYLGFKQGTTSLTSRVFRYTTTAP